MISAAQVIKLFDGTGPNQGSDYHVGGEYPEQVAGADSMVYYPGGYGTLREVSRMIQEAGPGGIAQAGGSYKGSYKRSSSRSRKHRKQRKQKGRRTQRR